MHFNDFRATLGHDLGALHGRRSTLPPLVVFSPMRWPVEHPRPQQLLTRLARHYRVFFIEAPVMTHADAYLATNRTAQGVEVVVPHTRVEATGFDDAQVPVLQALLARFALERDISEPVVWLYTPMALPLVDGLTPRAVIYDCIEDLAGASTRMREREAALMKMADVVVTSGPSLYEAHRGEHSNVHCLPHAVDADHFSPAALQGSSIASISARAMHAAIPNPRLGYFGPIDERVDLALVAAIADQRPDWQIVMAGRVSGIDPATLPRRPNIHWLGPQTYDILPHLQAHWDVCLLPLKCDESTRHASPHQVLEYLAGQKSVVSTPVHDVVALYGHIVRLAADPHAFVDACRAALSERGPLRRQRRIDALIAVHSCSWDRAAERVHKLLIEFSHETVGVPPETAAAMVAAAALQQAAGTRLGLR